MDINPHLHDVHRVPKLKCMPWGQHGTACYGRDEPKKGSSANLHFLLAQVLVACPGFRFGSANASNPPESFLCTLAGGAIFGVGRCSREPKVRPHHYGLFLFVFRFVLFPLVVCVLFLVSVFLYGGA